MASIAEKTTSSISSGIVGAGVSAAIMNIFQSIPFGDLRWIWVGVGSIALSVAVNYIHHHMLERRATTQDRTDTRHDTTAAAPIQRDKTTSTTTPAQTEAQTDVAIQNDEQTEHGKEALLSTLTPEQLMAEYRNASESLPMNAIQALGDTRRGQLMRLSLTVESIDDIRVGAEDRFYVEGNDGSITCVFTDNISIAQLRSTTKGEILEIEGLIGKINKYHIRLADW